MGFFDWLREFPIDENGTPDGGILLGLMALTGVSIWAVVISIIMGTVIYRLFVCNC